MGRRDGWLLNDRIRLIDLLRKSPAPAGFFYMCSRWRLVASGVRIEGRGRSLWNRSARAPGARLRRRSAPHTISSSLGGPPQRSLQGELLRTDPLLARRRIARAGARDADGCPSPDRPRSPPPPRAAPRSPRARSGPPSRGRRGRGTPRPGACRRWPVAATSRPCGAACARSRAWRYLRGAWRDG